MSGSGHGRGRPRDLDPSPLALVRRAQRAITGPQSPPPLADGDPDGEVGADAPEIAADAPMEEAVRMRAVYDARKSRLQSLAESVRLNHERGKLWTSAQVRERDAIWNASVEDRLDLVERLLDQIDGITPDQRKAFLAAARSWRTETKRILASVRA